MTTQPDALPVVKTATELWLVRHGETEWSKALRHTDHSDIPLTERGRRRARALRASLASQSFERVLTSPLSRARETAELAGYREGVQIDEGLMEWNYGVFEGKTTAELAHRLGSFSIWSTPVPEGEEFSDVAARADRVLNELEGTGGRCLVFSHGQFLRILAVRWLGLAPANGRLLAMDAGALGVLGHEHGYPVIRAWNLAGPPPWASAPSQAARAGRPGE